MKGLILKDLYLMKGYGKTFFLMIVIASLMIFAGKGENLSIALTYLAVLSVIMGISTISYDEASNGYSFLMTLPVTREKYVLEKYVISILMSGLLWLVAVLMGCLVIRINGTGMDVRNWIGESLVILGLMVFIEIIMIPIQIKFGMEKGRIILIFAMMVVGILGMLVVEKGVLGNIQIIAGDPDALAWVPYAAPVVLLILWFLSYNISCVVMRRKEL